MMVFLKIIKNKWTWITLLLLSLFIYITTINIKLNIEKKKTNELKEKVEKLEIENKLKEKEIVFQTNKEYIKEMFTNSDILIEKITSYELSQEILKTLNNISNDYIKSFPN